MESYDVTHSAWSGTGGNVVRSAVGLYIGFSSGRRPRSGTDDKIKYHSSRSLKILLAVLVRVNIAQVFKVDSLISSPKVWEVELQKMGCEV